ncbi:MAG: CRISPR-associated endonuclease Cas2 [Clostridium baratii]|uniref:CRISPR-associated endonuclease Cas2 n=1 Tax=Clostridium baratii TaxID=1561 RepID=UPI00242D81C6|nr:CRISPR-associated endonuclease Cas2 [Clostridium baratii]MBS6005968.1 CRISPR-associated endonuclease Cas2 [Clostridium baratii]MDU1053037.1 CRISPR-associated endonuclease Cas2 [Clostridium baratii]
MFVIITYDIKIQRINRVRKLLRMYLMWTQNSVFEGKITESKLQKCLNEVNSLIDRKEDSIYVYRVQNEKNIKKDVIGEEKNFDELFI